jgi:hypothetical protein
MNESIFSTYSTGENRVTASILAVLRCLALPRIERILGALIEDADFQLLRFQNQPAKGGKGIPDGEIGGSCRLLLETKIERNALNRSQLERHLERLNSTNEKDRMVLVLTPDDPRPALIDEMNDERLIWNSFAALNQAIEELLTGEKSEKEVISEREEFLLRELQKMLLAEGLVGSSRDVLVIAARHAWPLYNELHAYTCKVGRAFQPVKYIAFYSGNQIHPLVPLIQGQQDEVVFERGKNTGRLGELVNQALEKSERAYWPYKWSVHKVFLLSAPDAAETVKLEQPVENDITSSSGQRTAFTQNQRYVSLDALRKAKKTSDLEEA